MNSYRFTGLSSHYLFRAITSDNFNKDWIHMVEPYELKKLTGKAFRLKSNDEDKLDIDATMQQFNELKHNKQDSSLLKHNCAVLACQSMLKSCCCWLRLCPITGPWGRQ